MEDLVLMGPTPSRLNSKTNLGDNDFTKLRGFCLLLELNIVSIMKAQNTCFIKNALCGNSLTIHWMEQTLGADCGSRL